MSFLTSALGGSILGGVLSLVQPIVAAFAAKKQAEADILKAKALSELKVKEGELDAFKASLQSQDQDFDPDPLPANTPQWALLIRITMESLRVFVDAFRAFTRPGLTWAMILSLVMLIYANKVGSVEQIISDFVFTTSTAVMWWFGSRPLQRSK